jgi:hypothetical protein
MSIFFTTSGDAVSFERSVKLVTKGLQDSGYSVDPQQLAERFAPLNAPNHKRKQRQCSGYYLSFI